MNAQRSLWTILLYDVAEGIELGKLRAILGIEPAAREPRFRHPTPEYVRFEQSPLEQPVEAPPLASGERLQARIKYFDYGVMAVELELPFEVPWEGLIERSSQWIGAPEVEKLAAGLARQHAEKSLAAFTQPYSDWV